MLKFTDPRTDHLAGRRCHVLAMVNDYGTVYGHRLVLTPKGEHIITGSRHVVGCQCDWCRRLSDVWDQIEIEEQEEE